jgi:hypothetical protein
MTESQLQDQIRLELGNGELVLWRNNCGVAEMRGGFKVRFGVGSPGGSDLIGLYRGRALFVEIKTPTGRQSPEQRQFQQCVERHGGIYRILRSVDEARTFLEELRRGHD